MDKPLDLEDLLAEFDDSKTAWVIRERTSCQFLVIPDDRYPGRRPIRFFLSKSDAEHLAHEVVVANPEKELGVLEPFEVNLIPSLRSIAATTNPSFADSFIVHGPSEVYQFLAERLSR